MSKASPSPRTPRGLPEGFYRFAVYTPVLVAILLMLPRLLDPHFGLYDDGRMLVTASKIAHGIWYTGLDSSQGRFRPVYWLWFTLSYLLGGANPFWFYVANTLALVIIVAGLISLVRALGGSRLQACFAGFVFAFAGPVIESFLTLKGEVIQVTLILLSLVSLLLYAGGRRPPYKIAGIVLSTLSLILAYLTKETAIVLLPISLAWYLLARFWPGYERRPVRIAARGVYLLANLIATGVFFLLRKAVVSSQILAGTYSGQYSIQLGQMAASAIRWGGWLVRDFIWVLPISVLGIILLARRRQRTSQTLLFDTLIWMVAWICVYLPWNIIAEYYMLPFALGLAVFVSVFMVELIISFHESRGKRWTTIGVAGLSIVLLTGSLMNNLTDVRMQLAVDSVNARMMAFLVQNTGPGSTVLVNIQAPNEYFYEMQTQLGQVLHRPDLKVSTFQVDLTLAKETGTVYLVSPYVQNQPSLTVRMGVVENTQNHWDNTLQEFLQTHPGWQVVFKPATGFRLSDVNYSRLFCPFIRTRTFCTAPEPLVDTRQFNYGWTIDKLGTP